MAHMCPKSVPVREPRPLFLGQTLYALFLIRGPSCRAPYNALALVDCGKKTT